MFRKTMKIPIEVSARHIHLSKQDLEKLFGQGYQLKKLKRLTQPADFACQETLSIKSHSHILENVRIVGPIREQTQIEISKTDAFALGVNPAVRLSGDLKNSAGIILIGPNGEVELKEGLIIAKRHLHCATNEAKKLKLKNKDIISVKTPARNASHSDAGGESERPIVFEGVAVRVRDDYKLCLHLDTDEGNAAGIDKIGQGEIIESKKWFSF